MAKKTIAIQEFAPDMVDFDSPHMEVCENLVPIRGEYTPVFGGQDVGSIADTNRINSGYAHVVSQDLDKQTSRAESSVSTYEWNPSDSDVAAADTYTMINEVTPDDDSYVYKYDGISDTPSFGSARFKLSTLVDPSDISDHILSIRWKGWEAYGGITTSSFIANIYHFDGASTWTIVETGGDLIDESIIVSGDWFTAVATITEADITAILIAEAGFYDECYLVVEPTMSLDGNQENYYNGNPNSDSRNNFSDDEWETTDVGDVTWYTEIVEGSGDAAFITTPGMSESDKVSARFPLTSNSLIHLGGKYLPSLVTRAKASVSDDVYDRFLMYKDDELVYTSAWRELTTSFATDNTEPALGIYADWDFFDGIEMVWEVKNEATGGSAQTYLPTTEVNNFWDASNAATKTKDGLDTTYVESTDTTGGAKFKVNLAAVTVPSNHNNTKFRVKAQEVSGNGKLEVMLSDGTVEIMKRFSSDQLQSSFGWVTYNLTESQSKSLDWDQTFTIQCRKVPTSRSVQLRVSRVELITSADTVTADLALFHMKTAVDVGYEVAWAKFTIPSVEIDITGDSQRIYGGTQNDLWEVRDLDSGVVYDVTNDDLDAATHLYGNDDYPKVWDFCSWGGNVIATNYVDPVQLLDLENDATQFDNLITQVDDTSDPDLDADPTLAPRAKFCAVVQNSLVLANLDYTGQFSYSLCWSHINDPASFSFPSYTYLSDSQVLVQTPGEITGIVGGDYGIIFKRNSIYRMSYVGAPLMYRFDVLSRGVGTSYPKSIVVAGDDIYFFGSDGFYVMRGGQAPVPISEGKISRMMTDNPLEYYLADAVDLNSRSYYPHEYEKQFQIDSSFYGAYDRTNSIIYWFYTCQGDTGYWKKTKGVAYNIKSNRWGFVDTRELRDYEEDTDDWTRFRHVSVPIGLLNTRNDVSDRYGGLVVWSKHDIAATNSLWRPVSKYTRPAMLKTALVSSKALGATEGDSVTVKRVRPIFYNNDENSDYIRGMTLRLESSEDPYFNSTVSSDSVYGTNTDDSGWFDVVPLSGEYFRVRLDIPSWAHYNYRNSEFSGPVSGIVALQFDLEYAGEY